MRHIITLTALTMLSAVYMAPTQPPKPRIHYVYVADTIFACQPTSEPVNITPDQRKALHKLHVEYQKNIQAILKK